MFFERPAVYALMAERGAKSPGESEVGEASKKNILALGCLKCKTITHLEPCSNCGGTVYDINGTSLFCIRCTEGFSTWNCANCDTRNPISRETLMEKRGKGMCFVATAAYGSSLAPEVIILSRFRDDFLLQSKLGSLLVALYYHVSPPLASQIARAVFLRAATRTLFLAPILRLLKFAKFNS